MKFLLKTITVLMLLTVAIAALLFCQYPLRFALQQTRFHLWKSGVQSNYAEVDGYRLHYFEALPPHRAPDRPLLLIHGLGAKGEDWSPLIPGLAAQGFHVYAPDLLGYGRSPQPDVDYSIPLEEKLMADLLATLHVQQVDVVGWSMGGWIAMRLAADHPTLVTRLILADSAGTYFPTTFDATLFSPTDTSGLNHLMATMSPHRHPLPAFVARDALRFLKGNAWVIRRSMSAMSAGHDLMDFRLNEIHQPTLILWGGSDELIPLAVGERIHRSIPQSTLIILEGCGHLAPAECWRPFEQATLTFLTADQPPQGEEHHIPSPN